MRVVGEGYFKSLFRLVSICSIMNESQENLTGEEVENRSLEKVKELTNGQD